MFVGFGVGSGVGFGVGCCEGKKLLVYDINDMGAYSMNKSDEPA